jgi:hypothetical protein
MQFTPFLKCISLQVLGYICLLQTIVVLFPLAYDHYCFYWEVSCQHQSASYRGVSFTALGFCACIWLVVLVSNLAIGSMALSYDSGQRFPFSPILKGNSVLYSLLCCQNFLDIVLCVFSLYHTSKFPSLSPVCGENRPDPHEMALMGFP